MYRIMVFGNIPAPNDTRAGWFTKVFPSADRNLAGLNFSGSSNCFGSCVMAHRFMISVAPLGIM